MAEIDWSAYNNAMLSGAQFENLDFDILKSFMLANAIEAMQPEAKVIDLSELVDKEEG